MKVTLQLIDAFTEALGRALAWCVPLMVLITAAVVVMRYGFGQGLTALQES
ncbi:MAG: C4-dicarboxylate ABC transporter permease, partial [Spongiibacter sp.]|nr:C4-dicarboxylate ABC transporter permease [Spongiibacter sp.]